MIKTVIVDDQVLLRKSIGQLISTDQDIKVMGMASNGKEALDLCESIRPDIMLMDIEMPLMNGIESMKIIKKKYPKTKVIILTTFDNKDNIIAAFRAKADGYITKDVEPIELITVIKCVSYGLTVIHKSVKDIMVEKFEQLETKTKAYRKILTEEEVHIIKGIVDGFSNKELAKDLNYSEGTIKNKVSKIYDKIKVNDRIQLAIYAVENGIE